MSASAIGAAAEHAGEEAPPAESRKPCVGGTAPLDTKTYHLFPVADIKAVSRVAETKPDFIPITLKEMNKIKICPQGKDRGTCVPSVTPNLFINGTEGGGDRVYGVVMRRGKIDPIGGMTTKYFDAKSPIYGRGGVAILKNGKVVFCQPAAKATGVINEAAVNASCRVPGDPPVWEFLMGGFLIRDGLKACSWSKMRNVALVKEPCDHSVDLSLAQHFGFNDELHVSENKKYDGLDAAEFRDVSHTLLARKNGKLYAMFLNEGTRSGQTMQDELCAAGFDNVMEYDGGSGFSIVGQVKGQSFILGDAAPRSNGWPKSDPRFGINPGWPVTNGFLIRTGN